MSTELPPVPVAEIEKELGEFFERHPKCEAFAEIFHFLRSLEISVDVAADVAKSLLWAEGSGRKPNVGRFLPKITDEQFLSLFSEKAGASFAGLQQEAISQFRICASTFANHLRKHCESGAIYKTESGLWRLASK